MDKIFQLLIIRNSDAFNVEFGSSLTHSLLFDSRRLLMSQFRKSIMDIFDSDDFFKCSTTSLKHWTRIIDWCISMSKNDLLSEYLDK